MNVTEIRRRIDSGLLAPPPDPPNLFAVLAVAHIAAGRAIAASVAADLHPIANLKTFPKTASRDLAAIAGRLTLVATGDATAAYMQISRHAKQVLAAQYGSQTFTRPGWEESRVAAGDAAEESSSPMDAAYDVALDELYYHKGVYASAIGDLRRIVANYRSLSPRQGAVLTATADRLHAALFDSAATVTENDHHAYSALTGKPAVTYDDYAALISRQLEMS